MEYAFYGLAGINLALGLIGLGGYLHYRFGSKVRAAGEAALAELEK